MKINKEINTNVMGITDNNKSQNKNSVRRLLIIYDDDRGIFYSKYITYLSSDGNSIKRLEKGDNSSNVYKDNYYTGSFFIKEMGVDNFFGRQMEKGKISGIIQKRDENTEGENISYMNTFSCGGTYDTYEECSYVGSVCAGGNTGDDCTHTFNCHEGMVYIPGNCYDPPDSSGDPSGGGDGGDPYGGGDGSGGGEEDECYLAGDLNNDCEVDDYEECRLTHSNNICDCEYNDDCEELFKNLADGFNIDDDQQYNELTEEEKQLVRQYPFKAKKIADNKSIAYAETLDVMGVNGLNDCSDAFRHAFFNSINAKEVGVNVAELFGNAHESEVPQYLDLEKQMDLYNNSVGISVYETYPGSDIEDLSDIIAGRLYSGGELKFISPRLTPDQDNCFWGCDSFPEGKHGLLDNSTLVYTNSFNCN